MEDEIPGDGANVDLVGSYAPTPFGFGDFKKDTRPSDHRLR